MPKTCLAIALFLIIAATSAAIEKYPSGARALSLSNAVVSIPDVWATFHNQATLTNINSFSAGFFYESKFMTDELSHAAATFVLPAKPGTFGLSFSQFGKGTYKEHQLGFAFARLLGKKLAASLQFDYFAMRYPENEHAFGFATFEAGLLFLASEQISFGAHLFNPVQAGIKTSGELQKMPGVVRFGGHYQFPEMVIVALEAEQPFNGPMVVKSGIEFSPAKNLALRFGVSGKPVHYTAGLGYRIGNIITDIGFGYHGNLGVTPSISIQIEL
jgi:hypothetical protein